MSATGRARGRLRPGTRALVLGIVALAAVVVVRPPHAPPLYDGLGFPDEPYRWISAPVGSGVTKPPTPLTLTVDLTSRQPAIATTAEQGPQLAISLAFGALSAPAGATTVTLRGTPEAGPPPPPSGTLASNLYRWTATADVPGPVTLRPGGGAVLNLRADVQTQQDVVLESWDGKAWTQLTTRQVGTDIYAARIADLQPVALVKLDIGVSASPDPVASGAAGTSGAAESAASPGSAAGGVGGGAGSPQQVSSTGPGFGLWIGLGVVLLVLAFGLVLARRRSTRG